MLPSPLLDGLHRGLIGRKRATVDQDARDRAEWLAVLIGVADAHDTAFGKSYLPGALDLQKERVDRIVDENERLALEWGSARVDVRAGPIRNHALAVNATTQPFVLEFGIEVG